MIDTSPLQRAKVAVLGRAARARQRVILTVRDKSASGRNVTMTRVFEPYHRKQNKNGTVTYFGVDTKLKQPRQFNVENILNIQPARGRNRFVKERGLTA